MNNSRGNQFSLTSLFTIFANNWLRKDDWMTGRVLRTWLFTTDRQMYGVGQIISAIEVTLCLLQHDNLTILSVAARLSYWEPGYIIKYRKWKRDHPVDETFCYQSCIEISSLVFSVSSRLHQSEVDKDTHQIIKHESDNNVVRVGSRFDCHQDCHRSNVNAAILRKNQFAFLPFTNGRDQTQLCRHDIVPDDVHQIDLSPLNWEYICRNICRHGIVPDGIR